MSKRTLWEGAGIGIEVATFGPKEWHRTHVDRYSRITLTLQGDFQEITRTGSASVAAGDMLFKSKTVQHEDRFGESGVTLVSVVFRSDDVCALQQGGLQRLWSVRRSARHLRSGIAILGASFANDHLTIQAEVADLLSSEADDALRFRRPPIWLSRLKRDLESESLSSVDVAQRARDAGAHPAHASRLFRRCFSSSITEHATYHCVRRAIGMLGRGRKRQTLSEIAVAAGFYDQSHMNRTFVRLAGRTPGRYRALVDQITARSERIAG